MIVNKSFSQGIYFFHGRNSTSYSYRDNSNKKSPILNHENKSQIEAGKYYEAGFNFNGKKRKLSYMLSLTVSELNARYFISGTPNIYTWQTEYIGIQNVASFTFFRSKHGLELALKGGFNTMSLLRGEQIINGVFYNLKSEPDFAGIMIQPIIGLNLKYNCSNYFSLSLGLNRSTTVNVTEPSMEHIKFNNSQIQIGIYFPLTINK